MPKKLFSMEVRLIKLTYKSIFAYETILYDDIIYIAENYNVSTSSW